MFFDQIFASHGLYRLQRTANILSTEAPTEIGGNSLSYSGEKPRKNRNLDWLFFERMAAGLDWRAVWGWANTLSTDPPTGIVGKHQADNIF
ncbi:hypothetical protein [Pseudomonas sp. RA_15y_Pfl2_54]|uniref:hypothetical protein n=1 Tax=Pseudomonas sp. RA_15y_Pfl2_54 TaxID=3088704 RepID=UPI0030D97D8D